MMLNGYDLSSNNTAAQITTALGGDFVILKASEGQSYQWPGAQDVATRARAAGKLVGWYHFAHPGNGGAADAANFLAGAKAQPGERAAIDWEPYSQAGVTPAMAFPYVRDLATAIHNALGIWPDFYTNDDQLSKIQAAVSAADWAWLTATLPLWKAGVNGVYVSDPSKGPGNTYGFANVAAFQWSETPQDRDVFYGDATLWRSSTSQGDDNMAQFTEADIARLARQGVLDTRIKEAGSGTPGDDGPTVWALLMQARDDAAAALAYVKANLPPKA